MKRSATDSKLKNAITQFFNVRDTKKKITNVKMQDDEADYAGG